MLKRKITGAGASLSLAVALALGGGMMGVSTPANAVSVAHDNLGDVLVFPYYTVNEGWATYFNITNTSGDTVVAKVRWREGHNSREVRDFNIVLSPYDVWTAAVVPDAATGGAKMVTTDNSCTMPKLGSAGDNLTGVSFTSYLFNGPGTTLADAMAPATADRYDGGPKTNDRQREGYFEVISMGRVGTLDVVDPVVVKAAGDFAKNVKHDSSVSNNAAMPKDCNAARTYAATHNLGSILDEPRNVLKGRAVLIRPRGGEAMGYDPLTLANFFSPLLGAPGFGDGDSGANLYYEPGSTEPNLNQMNPQVASWVNDTNGMQMTASAGNLPVFSNNIADFLGADMISALLLRSNVYNDYNIANTSATQWVLTMPTKNFYADYAENGMAYTGPFSEKFYGKSCEPVTLRAYDREEFTEGAELDFSPREELGNNLCKEVNLLAFGDDDLFGQTDLVKRFAASDLPADNGWVNLSFEGKNRALPVIGFRAEVRDSGKSALNYGFANQHAYKGHPDPVSR